MHKGVILLVKASTREEAESAAEAFMEPHGDCKVWDWFVVGGRWSGQLTGYDPNEDPRNKETNHEGEVVTKWPTDWEPVDDDIVKLPHPKADEVIKEWSTGWKQRALDEIQQGEGHFAGDKGMLRYYKRKRKEVNGDKFSFETSVFDVERNTNQPPEDMSGYWAVMIDMHN